MALTMEQVEETLSRILRGVHGHEEVIALHDHLTTLEADRARMDWLEGSGKADEFCAVTNEHGCNGNKWMVRRGRKWGQSTSLREAIDKASTPTQESNQV